MAHERFMHRCLELASRAQGKVGNGALVGAVLVRGETIIAEAAHEGFGQLHAERRLLDGVYPERSRRAQDDVLYVNLEPCCHQGKTPPCTDIIIEGGIKHVVYGMQDPDSRVAGKGIQILRENGIEVIGPVCEPECQRLNKGFVSLRTKGRPYITLKRAQMRDGTTSTSGKRLMITSREQDVWAHTFLRSTHDAILVGVETIIKDDPILDARFSTTLEMTHPYQPWRIILDPQGRIPKQSKVLTNHPERTIVVRSQDVSIKHGVFDWDELWKKLITPNGAYHGLTSILVEGGAKTWDAFKNAGMVDEEVILIGK